MGDFPPFFPMLKIIAWIKFILLGFFLFLHLSLPLSAQDLEVEVEVAPEFDPNDQYVITNCMMGNWSGVFPLDFIWDAVPEPSTSPVCPSLTIFHNTYEACFLVDIYEQIEPAILIGLFTYAIINL